MSTITEEEQKSFRDALRALQQEAAARGLDKLTMEEIDAIIADYRREEREKKEREKLAG